MPTRKPPKRGVDHTASNNRKTIAPTAIADKAARILAAKSEGRDPAEPRPFTRAAIYQALRESLQGEAGNGVAELYKQFVGIAMSDPNSWQNQLLMARLLPNDAIDKITTDVEKLRAADIDFARYRCIKECFGPQLLYVMTRSRLVLCMAGRRSGKTEGNVRLAGEQAMVPDSTIVIIGLTAQSTSDLYMRKIGDLLSRVGADYKTIASEWRVELSNGSRILLRGNSTTDEREKLRGERYDLCIVDEAQSQKALPYLVDDILTPATVDRRGRIVLSGTGPRVRGTYWERLWAEDKTADRHHWDLRQNPHIPDGAAEFARILAAKNLTEDSPLFVREYLGLIAYDDDALVFRLGDQNYFEMQEFVRWAQGVPVSDLRIVGGLDFGFDDADALALIAYAERRPERWLVGEYKARRSGTLELADAIKAEIAKARALPIIGSNPEAWRAFRIYADTGGLGKKINADLASQFGLPVATAYKHDKALGIELLRDEIGLGNFRVKRGGVFDEEALRTVFRRDAADNLTRELDEEVYHGDLIPATIYAMRTVQLYGKK